MLKFFFLILDQTRLKERQAKQNTHTKDLTFMHNKYLNTGTQFVS